MTVPFVMRYFWGVLKSSVRNQPLMSAGLAVGLYNSTASTSGGSVWVNTSLTSTGTKTGGAGSLCPGEPANRPLGRQLLFNPQVLTGAVSSTMTSEKPAPSV